MLGEANALEANAGEHIAEQEFLHTLAADPFGANHLADLVSQWGDHAPTLPPGAIFGLASSGIGPTHPVGQQVIKSAVPALSQPKDALDRANAAAGAQGPSGPGDSVQQAQFQNALDQNTPGGGGGGGVIGGIEHDIGSGLSTAASATGHAIAAGASDVAGAIHSANQPLQAGLSPNPQAAGFGNTNEGKAVAREAFAGGEHRVARCHRSAPSRRRGWVHVAGSSRRGDSRVPVHPRSTPCGVDLGRVEPKAVHAL